MIVQSQRRTPRIIATDVRDYGAIFDNDPAKITANTTAIQNALNAAVVPQAGLSGNDLAARIVQLPPGRAYVTSLIIPPNVWLRGHGPSATYLYRTGATGGAVLAATGGVQQYISDLGIISDRTDVDCIDLSGQGGPSIIDGRIVVRDVVCVGGRDGLNGGGNEMRVSRVTCQRQYRHGFNSTATDSFFEGCTAAESGQVNVSVNSIPAYGFTIAGANSRFYGCKVFGQHGTFGQGYGIAGAGRHEMSCCEAQDCEGGGFNMAGNAYAVLSSCIADSCGQYGFSGSTIGNVLTGCGAINRGGGLYTMYAAIYAGAGYIVKGFFTTDVLRRVEPGLDPALPMILDIDNRYGPQTAAYAATVTPNPWKGQDVYVGALTGNVTIANPAGEASPIFFQQGMCLRFHLTQDVTGGRAVTFGANYKTTAAIDTTLSTTTTITFIFDGTNWRETARTVTT